MERLIKPLIAYFFLLCFAVSMVPFSAFHHHHDTEHCELSDAELALDPCHIAVYHPDKLHDHQCDHKSHVNAEEERCPVCELQISYEEKYTAPNAEDGCSNYISAIEYALEHVDPTSSVAQFCFSRGPPA